MPVLPLILVGEDEAVDQFLLRRAVQKAEVNVDLEFANDGAAVLRYLQQSERIPKLLLLDLKMPRMDGFEVLEWLTKNVEVRPQHVIVLSSCAQGEDLSRCCKLGVDHYLVKPDDPLELAAILKRLEPYWAESKPKRRSQSAVVVPPVLASAA